MDLLGQKQVDLNTARTFLTRSGTQTAALAVGRWTNPHQQML